MIKYYREESSHAKWNAQRNLEGRTHYVDDGTLRFHKSRILRTVITDNGLLFALVESYAADYLNTSRRFRPVIFDVFGNVLERAKLEDGYETSKQATEAMWGALNAIDAKQVTIEAMQRQIERLSQDIEDINKEMAELSTAA